MVPQRTVSFKCRPMHVNPRAYVCITYEKRKISLRKSRGLTWENKKYKLNRSIKQIISLMNELIIIN